MCECSCEQPPRNIIAMPANRIALHRNMEVSGIAPPGAIGQLIDFNASSIQKWKMLPCPYTFTARNHESGRRASCQLNDDKPEPGDPFAQHRINCSEYAVDNCGSNDRHRDAAQQNRVSRKHG